MRLCVVLSLLLLAHASHGASHRSSERRPQPSASHHNVSAKAVKTNSTANHAHRAHHVHRVHRVPDHYFPNRSPSGSKPRIFIYSSRVATSQSQQDRLQYHRPIYGHGSARRHISPIVIAFAVLGGIFGLFVVVGLVHCLLDYSRAPHRHTVMPPDFRERLLREMAENAENAERDRLAPTPTPPPPYERPPSYQPSSPNIDDPLVASPLPHPLQPAPAPHTMAQQA
ncbi:colonization front upregulated 1 [Heterobasidion irregulare TC 32-1]|uniref:Colonization front upregulated 1 n=1 Tax=Heterobasidion irregulare (strain TC 32-1) TaxID=747525 RepID=W4KI20_HETIT|nr:colonization front upregulated 1 [Heterobasidion irregulare TC 32-1]ETW84965.1 colonization front upregulated 1 [Heterobasidion irregulare TC 32-1]